MREIRTATFTAEKREEVVDWLIANCRHRVFVLGHLSNSRSFLNTPQAWKESDDLAFDYQMTVRFGSVKEAMLFKMKWC